MSHKYFFHCVFRIPTPQNPSESVDQDYFDIKTINDPTELATAFNDWVMGRGKELKAIMAGDKFDPAYIEPPMLIFSNVIG